MTSSKNKRLPSLPGRKPNHSLCKARKTPLDETADRFLGIIAATHENEVRHEIVPIRPLFYWEDKWIPVPLRTDEAFVQWRKAPQNVSGGTLWEFGIVRERNEDIAVSTPNIEASLESYAAQDRGAHMEQSEDVENPSGVVTDSTCLFVRTDDETPVFVYEIIPHDNTSPLPRRNVTDPSQPGRLPPEEIEKVRQRYVLQGVDTPPLGPVLAEIKGQCVIGPLVLHRHQDGKWRAAEAVVAVRAPFLPQLCHIVEVESVRRKICIGSYELPQLIAEVDFRSDKNALLVTIEEMFAATSNLVQEGTNQENVHCLLAKIAAQSQPLTQPAEAYQLYRLENALKCMEEDIELKAKWREAILNTPEAKACVETAQHEAIASAMQEAEDAINKLQKQLEDKQSLVNAASQQLDDRRRRIAELEAQTLLVSNNWMEATDDRIASIAFKVAENVAEQVIAKWPVSQTILASNLLTPVLGTVCPPNEHCTQSILTPTLVPLVHAWRTAQADGETIDFAEALNRLEKGLRSAGFPSLLAPPLLAAWLADLMPVVAGTDTLRFLRNAARCLTAKRFLSVSVTPEIVSVADLFGRVNAARRAYVPSASGLADALLATASGEFGDGMGIVAFSGVNSIDIAPVFLPLIEA